MIRLPRLLGVFLLTAPSLAQAGGQTGGQTSPLRARPVPMPRPATAMPEPASPPAQVVADDRAHVRFRLPAGWEVSRQDGEMSTFHLDARTAPRNAQLRVVADLAFNPYPRSTFSGALFYLSVTPHSTAEACAAQATSGPAHTTGTVPVADVRFTRGHDEHGQICTEARDDVYTALRSGSCVRFDLAMNSFCGGEVSGAQDLTEDQIRGIEARLQGILQTVEFTGKGSGGR